VLNPFLGVDAANKTLTVPITADGKLTITPLADIGALTADAIVTGRGRNQIVLWHFGGFDPQLRGAQVAHGACAPALHSSRLTRSKAELEAAVAANPHDYAARFGLVIGANKGASWPLAQTYNQQHDCLPPHSRSSPRRHSAP